MTRLVPASLAGVLLLAAGLSARQQPTFRTGTRTVEIYATVTGQDGRLVPDLTRDDFEILDNGRPQPITVFANTVQPITVVMMLDRSGSVVQDFGLVAAGAERFVDELLPIDQAKIGSFSNRIQVDPREFTTDHDTLLGILRTQLQEPGPTPLWNAVNVGMTDLLHVEGRRVVLVFTDGMDSPGGMGGLNQSLRDVMRRAQEEDMMVYAIGLIGRAPARSGGFRGGFRYPGGGFGGRRGGGGRRGFKEQKPDPGLAKLAAESGGGYFELQSTADLKATFARVADELHHQYALGFTPQKLDGKTHKLEVLVKRPGATARARKSYVAAPERG